MWRSAKSLEKLLEQVNVIAPHRSKVSDGGIGDTAHASRSSDHNPWITDNGIGVYSARDFTHDPTGGLDAQVLVDQLVKSRDPRIKYIIWNKQIISSETSPWKWRKYTGTNPHTKHVHLSVKSTKSLYDSVSPWSIGPNLSDYVGDTSKAPSVIVQRPLLRKGESGHWVRQLQELLNQHSSHLRVDGEFGNKTLSAVKAFQTANKLVPDGIVGVYTWDALTHKE